ncbi:MAG: EI24 domain-containing protein [Alphaproteobacteria bacterium]|nr:EI24 domain-containing protein [Alphaproteobacteria bacterium]
MIHAFFRTLGQLSDPAFRGLLMRGVGLAIAAMACLWFLAWILFRATTVFDIGWLEGVFDIGGFAAVLLLTVLLFPAFVTLSLSFFLEDVLATVERRDYPDLPAPRTQGFTEILITTAKFTGALILLNLLVLPIYLLPILGAVPFLMVNGYLLGREYMELVAPRRMTAKEVKVFRVRHWGSIFWAGMTIAVFSTIPGLNLAAPALGAALMLHLFERLREKAA